MSTVIHGTWREVIIRHSRFVSRAFHIASAENLADILAETAEQWPKATHYVWAYVLETGQERMTDDGEPLGTAGPPTLTLLRKRELVKSAIVTVRYFGGTKLGTGGLVHAYHDSALYALSHAQLGHEQEIFSLTLEIPYAEWGRTENFLVTQHIAYTAEFYNHVKLTCELPYNSWQTSYATLQTEIAPHVRLLKTEKSTILAPDVSHS